MQSKTWNEMWNKRRLWVYTDLMPLSFFVSWWPFFARTQISGWDADLLIWNDRLDRRVFITWPLESSSVLEGINMQLQFVQYARYFSLAKLASRIKICTASELLIYVHQYLLSADYLHISLLQMQRNSILNFSMHANIYL